MNTSTLVMVATFAVLLVVYMKPVVVPDRDVPAAGQINHHACASQVGGDVKLAGDVVNAGIQHGRRGRDGRGLRRGALR